MAKAQILIVEDEAIVAADIKGTLKGLGYDVPAIAFSGEEALRKTEELHPDVVLMDIVLRGQMDGIEAAQEIRKRFGIPVVYLTAYADEKTLTRAKITEPFGYMLKPFGEKELHSSIEIALYKYEIEKKLKESEEKYRELVQNANSIILRRDPKGRITFFNEFAQKFFGYTEDEILGKNVVGAIVPETDTSGCDLKAMIEDIGRNPERYATNENENMRHNGERVWIAWTNKGIFDKDGHITEILCIGNDITEQKQLQKHLQHTQKMEAAGTFALGIAHEFNNSLAAIHGYAQLLVRELKPKNPMVEYLQKISERCKQAAELAQKMLNYSRPDIGEMAPVNVNQVLEEVQQLLRHTLPSQIKLERKLQKDLSLVMAGSTQLEQVLLNLVMNAIDAMPNGGKISLKSCMMEPDEGFRRTHVWAKKARYVEVMVKDTGEGMPPEVLERIFDPFFTTKEPGKGTGLGLSITYSTLENYGGSILAESQVGQGSCFKIYLPAMIDKEAEEALEPAGKEGIAPR